MKTTEFQDDADARDANFEEPQERRANEYIRRGKVSKRRSGPKNCSGGTPSGIRQRRNKRWAW